MKKILLAILFIQTLMSYTVEFTFLGSHPVGFSDQAIQPMNDEGGEHISPLFTILNHGKPLLSDPHNNRMIIIDESDKFITIPDSEGLLVRAVMMVSDGQRLFIFSDGTLTALDLDGKKLWNTPFPPASVPVDIVVAKGYLFIIRDTHSKSIVLNALNGSVIGLFGLSNDGDEYPYLKTEGGDRLPYLLEHEGMRYTFIHWNPITNNTWRLSSDRRTLLVSGEQTETHHLPAIPADARLGVIQSRGGRLFASLLFKDRIEIVEITL